MKNEVKLESITVREDDYPKMLEIALEYFNVEKITSFKQELKKYYVIYYSTPKENLYDNGNKTLKKAIKSY